MRADGGFTLAEVLVALFVVAVGVAGAAGVHARALRAGREAAYLSDGVQLAAALAERMRANPAAMALPDHINPYLDTEAASEADSGAPACDAGTACGPADLARFDLAETVRALTDALPGGRVLACRDGGAGSAGTDAWACDGAAGADVVIKLGWRSDGAAAVPRVLLPVGAQP